MRRAAHSPRAAVRPRRAGFTIVELLVAVGIGLFVANVALMAFFFDQKLIHRIEVLSAKNDVAQSMVMWSIAKQGQGTSYPTGAQFRQIGAAAMTYQGVDQYFQLDIQDWSQAKTTGSPAPVCKLVIPVTGG